MTTLCRLLALSRRELGLLVAVFVVSLPAVTVRIYASDEIQYFSYLRSLWFDRDVSFENEYRYFYERGIGRGEGFHSTFLELQTEAGRRPNFGTLGSALLWAPFYATADVIARALRSAGADVEVDGFSGPYVAAVAYGSAVYGFAAVLLSIAAARRYARTQPGTDSTERPPPSRLDLLAGVLIWFGTPLLFYMYVAPPYSHACSAFAVALFVTLWLHVRRHWSLRGVVLLGLSAALMGMVREQDVVLALGPAVDFLLDARTRPVRSSMALGAAGCTACAVGFLPQLVAYSALNGRLGPSTLVTRKMSWYAPHALEVLMSTRHGFLFWTPLAALAVCGLAVLARRGDRAPRRIAGCALVMVAVQVYVSGSVESWTVAGAFGQRRFVALTVLLTIGLASLLQALPTPSLRRAAGALAMASVWWNLALTAQFGAHMMNRQRLELGRNAYAAFVTVPAMAPSLAWRYLTNRRSFLATEKTGPQIPPNGAPQSSHQPQIPQKTQTGSDQAAGGRR